MYKLIIAALGILALYLAFNFINHKSVIAPITSNEKTSIETITEEGTGIQTDQKPTTHLSSLTSKASADASVFLIEPLDGAVLNSPISVKFGLSNMQIAPAGKNIDNSGHHHLLVDMDDMPDLSSPLPATDQLIHFGKGQTETQLELSPGTHTLQLLLGNYLHIPHSNPVVSEKITITVQ